MGLRAAINVLLGWPVAVVGPCFLTGSAILRRSKSSDGKSMQAIELRSV